MKPDDTPDDGVLELLDDDSVAVTGLLGVVADAEEVMPLDNEPPVLSGTVVEGVVYGAGGVRKLPVDDEIVSVPVRKPPVDEPDVEEDVVGVEEVVSEAVAGEPGVLLVSSDDDDDDDVVDDVAPVLRDGAEPYGGGL